MLRILKILIHLAILIALFPAKIALADMQNTRNSFINPRIREKLISRYQLLFNNYQSPDILSDEYDDTYFKNQKKMGDYIARQVIQYQLKAFFKGTKLEEMEQKVEEVRNVEFAFRNSSGEEPRVKFKLVFGDRIKFKASSTFYQMESRFVYNTMKNRLKWSISRNLSPSMSAEFLNQLDFERNTQTYFLNFAYQF